MKETRFKDTEVGKIPEEWTNRKMGQCFYLKGRIGWQGLKAHEFQKQGPFLVTGTDFEDGHINWSKCYHITMQRFMQDTKLQVFENDVLITKDGTIGKLAFVDNVPGLVSLNSHLLIIRPLLKDINNQYVYYHLKGKSFSDYVDVTHTGTTMASLSQGKIANYKIVLPPYDEQKRIATTLSSIDVLLSELSKLIEKKRAIKQGAMQMLLTGKKRLKGFEGEWVEKKLGEIGALAMCKRIFQEETSGNGDVPFYKIGTFGQEADAYISKVKYEQFKRMYRFPNKGDILISAAGTIGRTVVYDGKPAYFQDSNIIWLAHNEKHILNIFLFYVYQRIVWNTENTTIARLYNNNFNNTVVVFPKSREEQSAIASVLTSMDNEITALEAKKSKYEAIKQGMMQQLLTGRIRLVD